MSEWYTMEMEDTKLKDLVLFCALRTEAEILLLSKADLVHILNENARKDIKYKPQYPEFPCNVAVAIDKLDISYTRCTTLKTIGSPRDEKYGTGTGTGTSTFSGDNASMPPLEVDPSITTAAAASAAVVTADADTGNAIAKEAVKATNTKNNELAINITQKCQDLPLPDKKKILSDFKKEYNRWFEKYIETFFKKYCGSFEDLSLIGTASKLCYDMRTVEWVTAALREALRICIRIPSVDQKPVLLLTKAKANKLLAYTCQFSLQYGNYYKYVNKNRATASDEDLEKLWQDGQAEIDRIKFNKGAKKNIIKVLTSFHFSLSSDTVARKKSNKKRAVGTEGTSSNVGKRKKKGASSDEDNEDEDDDDEYRESGSDDSDGNDKPPKKKSKVSGTGASASASASASAGKMKKKKKKATSEDDQDDEDSE
jgi:hypothetical protein